jgi:hypothetical protein
VTVAAVEGWLGGGGAPAADWRQQVGEKLHSVQVKLSRGLQGSDDVWGGDSALTRRSAAVGVCGGDAPGRDWRGERVGELRGVKSELLAGLIWGGEGRRGGFDGEVELAGV